uniref:Putative ovule protein n=1 Tax=Solanum chacoense TaxID=4108 RepID=A0A0V0GZK9_SOLCH
MQAPSDLHWKAVKRVLRYLRGTIQLSLRVTPIDEFNLPVYSDADWGGDIVDRVSTSGYILFLGHNPISWSSKKQNTVSCSSTESEYRAVANALSETLWVTNLLNELHFPVQKLPTIYCDNLGATFLSKNPVLHSRVKHAAVDFHFVRHYVDIKRVRVVHIHGADQIADTLTKALPKSAFESNLFKLGLVTHRLT